MKTHRDSARLHLGRLAAVALFALVCAVTIAACSSSPSPTVAPATRTPKPTFTAVVETPTPFSSPTPLPSPTPIPSPTSMPSPTPTVNPYWNPLTGELVQDPAVLQRRPLLVRIGNDPEIRPQSGLSQADMVFEEALDAYTMTRFTAVIWSKDPEELRPIRSARLLTIQLGYMFDGALVHSGANDQVRWLISQSTVTDLDQYFNDPVYYWITPEGEWKQYVWMGRVGTSAKRVRDWLVKKGKEKAVNLPGFTFSGPADAPPKGEPAVFVHIPYPRRAVVDWRYDAEKHLYLRFVRDVPHTDALNGQQLTASNVILHYTKYEMTEWKDANGAATFDITFTGEGRAQIVRDGVVIEAKWSRPDIKDFCKYSYPDGSPVLLRPGQMWVEVVPTDYEVTYKSE